MGEFSKQIVKGLTYFPIHFKMIDHDSLQMFAV